MVAKSLKALLLGAALVAAPSLAIAQDRAQSLADIRQELTVLYVEIQKLKTELSTTGSANVTTGAGSLSQRMSAIEGELSRLTSKTEQLEFRINSIVKDGTNRIGDLEFRLVELEGGDISKLGETSTLGGGAAPVGPVAAPAPTTVPESELAIGEKQDFDAAGAALEAGDYVQAATLLTQFVENYPGSPLTSEAHFQRGEALTGAGDVKNAARAYLNAFSGAPNNDRAPDALYRLGFSLGELGQVNEACATLAEVGKRFPGAPAVADAQTARQALSCP
ncbi:tol-pal system protein YbgF [Aliiroseovarius halocynthiae]|uniref:Cell division coordinator CpoB n=1 Tax=Aliiroseovarius halocynthiae TaxID=985055 RepID=A0A545SV12_9RHOB|nr:tol-pal system protein YbgF [Aliiroseovarius halocynthiae]TQV68805.1 tol-pal system protein YbgF [Aliiroseovarius halocynthiae]SMR71232.1 tol-pal system protein YbgF [Aliiroseovarius halocynthiae]